MQSKLQTDKVNFKNFLHAQITHYCPWLLGGWLMVKNADPMLKNLYKANLKHFVQKNIFSIAGTE
jgi:hypothetical protein